MINVPTFIRTSNERTVKLQLCSWKDVIQFSDGTTGIVAGSSEGFSEEDVSVLCDDMYDCEYPPDEMVTIIGRMEWRLEP